MPAQGIVTVEVSPWQANAIVRWLESVEQDQRRKDAAPLGIIAEAIWPHRDQHDVRALAAKFRKVANRKRSAGPFKQVDVQISRGDAAWLAKKVQRRGMFGGGVQPYLPSEVRMLANLCSLAGGKTRGRKKLEKDQLASALVRQHIDERHRKRLRRRQREEAAARESAANYKGVLAKALMDALKST